MLIKCTLYCVATSPCTWPTGAPSLQVRFYQITIYLPNLQPEQCTMVVRNHASHCTCRPEQGTFAQTRVLYMSAIHHATMAALVSGYSCSCCGGMLRGWISMLSYKACLPDCRCGCCGCCVRDITALKHFTRMCRTWSCAVCLAVSVYRKRDEQVHCDDQPSGLHMQYCTCSARDVPF